MEAWQLALIAWHGLQLLLVLVGVGVEAAKRPPAEPAAMIVEEFVEAPPAEAWAFSLPEPGDAWMVRR